MALFTTANARDMAIRGNQVRWAPKPPPVIEPQVAELVADLAPDYSQRTLARVRIQLDRLFTMLDEEDDPMRLDKLASAIARLADLEQKLSMRPNPGTLRPAAPTKAQRTTQGPSLPPATS